MKRATFIALVLACSAALVAVPATAATPPFKSGATYAGVTSQGNDCLAGESVTAPCKMSLVPKSGGRGLVVRLRLSETCDDGLPFRYGFVSKFPVRRRYVVKPLGTFKLLITVNNTFEGGEGESKVAIDGRFYRTKSGRYRARAVIRSTSTLTFTAGGGTKCRSGEVTAKLRRQVPATAG